MQRIRQARPPRPVPQGAGSAGPLNAFDGAGGGKGPRSKRVYFLLLLIPVAVTVWNFLRNHGDVASTVSPTTMRSSAPPLDRREVIETQRPSSVAHVVRSPSPSAAAAKVEPPPPPPPPPPPVRRAAKSPPPAEPPPPAPIPPPTKPPVRCPTRHKSPRTERKAGFDLLARPAFAPCPCLWSIQIWKTPANDCKPTSECLQTAPAGAGGVQDLRFGVPSGLQRRCRGALSQDRREAAWAARHHGATCSSAQSGCPLPSARETSEQLSQETDTHLCFSFFLCHSATTLRR